MQKKPNLTMVNIEVLLEQPDIPGYILRAVHVMKKNKGFINTGKFFQSMSLQELQDILNLAQELRQETARPEALKNLLLFVLVLALGEGLPGIEEDKIKEGILTLVMFTTLSKFDKLAIGKAQYDKFEIMSLDPKAILFIPAEEKPDEAENAEQPK